MMHNFIEFFEDENGKLQMSRLLSFLSFFPGTGVLLSTPPEHIETVFGIYMGAFVLGYVGGRVSERIRIGQPDLAVPPEGP